ncbi:hypothetical protein ACJVQT_22990 [Enterobacter huaxiensis]|uniref:hypothetical protein n=1 Tax=Enterobacter huaxiensis TaxID=2494702 RepID=UPI002175E8A6|nr:hypothetical protein [Enterobacter huaxiensis]MCS5452533.1 hypothetical protein [Enterobacter huaxiensis]
MAKGSNFEELLCSYWNQYAGILSKDNNAFNHTHYLSSKHEIEHYAKTMSKVARRVYPRGKAYRRMLKMRDSAKGRHHFDFFTEG